MIPVGAIPSLGNMDNFESRRRWVLPTQGLLPPFPHVIEIFLLIGLDWELLPGQYSRGWCFLDVVMILKT